MPDEIFTELADLFPHEMVVSGYTSATEKGVRTYAAGVTVPCRIVNKNRVVKDLEGQSKLSTAHAICQGNFSIDPYSVVLLPAEFDPRSPSIINVDRDPDENGAHHETVFFE